MPRRLALLLGMLLAAGAAAAQQPRAAAPPPEVYVTVKDRLMCYTQASLRDATRAEETRDKQLMSSIKDCHYSVDGIPAIVLQDNISRIRIRLMADGERADMWTTPETIRKPRGDPMQQPDD